MLNRFLLLEAHNAMTSNKETPLKTSSIEILSSTAAQVENML